MFQQFEVLGKQLEFMRENITNQLSLVPHRVQSIVNCIADEFKRRFYGQASLIWFGSWMKGTAYPHSDIDLAIEYPGALSEKELTAFRIWLDDLPTLYRIDLVDMKSAGEKLRAEIKRYGKIL